MSRRLVIVAVGSLIVVAVGLLTVLALLPGRAPQGAGPATPSPADPAAGPASPVPTGHPSPGAVAATDALAWVADVDAAGRIDAERLLAAGLALGAGPWADLAGDAWPMQQERPVYVVDAEVTDDGRVDAEVVLAHRLGSDAREVVLRFLPAADALADGAVEVHARVDGRPARATLDPGGLLRIGLPGPTAGGEAVRVRLTIGYRLLAPANIAAAGGPAAFGILADHGGTLALGHWLPVLTREPEPIVPWGDLGAFPPAVWSVRLTYDGIAVTGGAETACEPRPTDRQCVWAQGTALRDLAVVVMADGNRAQAEAGRVLVRSTVAPRLTEAAAEVAATEAARGLESFAGWFGPLAWPDLDIVEVPLGRGAAGMEFPGLVMIDSDAYDAFGGGFGSFVLHHETAHQYFHALVGNGSFSDPVVDEATAQYLTVLAYRRLFGDRSADRLVEDRFAQRYLRFRESGVAEEPPAQPTDEFGSSAAYGALVYARGPLGWLAVEEVLGQERLLELLATLVDQAGLGWLTAQDVIAAVDRADADAGAVLRRYWTSPQPVDPPVG